MAGPHPHPDNAPARRLFALSFLALFLELMVIRWVPGAIQLVAYYANLMLISSFLGLGLGAILASRATKLIHWFPAVLAADILFLALCRNVLFPGTSSELRFFMPLHSGVTNYLVLIAVFVLNTAVFVPLGQQIGAQFQQLPNLRAYAWDLGGSLAGTLVFGAFAVLHFSPQIGLAAAMILYGWLFPEQARQPRTLVLLVTTLALSVVATEWRATWSAYSYLSVRPDSESGWHWYTPAPRPPAGLMTMRDPPGYILSVNQGFYQFHRTNDLQRYTPGSSGYRRAVFDRIPYAIPYAFQPTPRRVVVAGGGGGLDVEAALLHGAQDVDVAEIDPTIVRLARRYSAAGVYGNPRVKLHIGDARAFFEQATPGYDLVTFGFLDSQGLFSSMANVRLDGFVYTVEGLRAAWRLLDDRGVLVLSFATAGQRWLAEKLYRMAAATTGRTPRAYMTHTGGLVLLVEKQPIPNPPAAFGSFRSWQPRLGDLAPPPATDDWPYLYMRQPTIPADYAVVIVTLLALSIVAVARLRPAGSGAEDVHFGALGMGFLLLETKSIVDASLYFGATWLVSFIVIAGVLLMVLGANSVAARTRQFTLWLYVPLLGSILLVFAVPTHVILALPFGGRIAWTALVMPLPIFFAGLVFSGTFKRAAHPAAAFGANLIGAVVGGFAEYLSMATGRKSLVVVILGAYLVSFAALMLRQRAGELVRRAA